MRDLLQLRVDEGEFARTDGPWSAACEGVSSAEEVLILSAKDGSGYALRVKAGSAYCVVPLSFGALPTEPSSDNRGNVPGCEGAALPGCSPSTLLGGGGTSPWDSRSRDCRLMM
jgi:hypothetical protein